MSNWRFILISAVIFLTQYLFSIFWPFLLQANVLVIWILTCFFIDRPGQPNFAPLLGAVIFFDFWSGNSFGHLTLVLIFTLLLAVLLKKIILLNNRDSFPAFGWLSGFYLFFLFLTSLSIGILGEGWFWPHLSLSALIAIFFWTAIMILLNKTLSNEKKRVSSF